jgi:hypothetical protein
MKKTILTLVLACPLHLSAQEDAKEARKYEAPALASPIEAQGISDRAGGTHNKSNIGLFFENRGKLYPRRLSQGPSGEYPIGSGRHYIYRINPFVGVPNNVVQGRFTTNEEWEARAGYHNRALAQIAFSDKPETWPASGWPVKDRDGNPIFRSDQDSYCVYSDSNNTRAILGIEVHQTGYAYGVKFARDMIFFKFDIVNNGAAPLDSLYFAMYMDIDAGNVSGGDPEWADEKIGFDAELQLLYDYDADNYTSEWPGNNPGEMGIVFLRTPKVNGAELGITDLHWFLYDDFNVLDIDSVQYGIISSARNLFNSLLGPKFFHLGANASNLHFDDLSTQDAGGNDTDSFASSGPYTLGVGDTLTFITAIVAALDHRQLLATARVAHNIVDLDFEVARPPDAPRLTAVPGDGRVTLYWDNRSELVRDKFSNEFDFEGYRIYKSLDKGASWDQIDRNANPTAGPDPVPLAAFDRLNGLGEDSGLQYSFVDTNVVNGLGYWYSITAYDRGDSVIESLETSRGATLESPNIAAVSPRQDAIGRQAARPGAVAQLGTGTSNAQLLIEPTDQAAGRSYTVEFAPIATVERGNLASTTTVQVTDFNAATTKTYAILFKTPATFDVLDVATNTALQSNVAYTSGAEFFFDGLTATISDDDPAAPLDYFPEAGDSIVISRGLQITSGADLVLPRRRLEFAKTYSTSNGLILAILPATAIDKVTPAGGSGLNVSASVLNEADIVDETYRLIVTGVNGAGSSLSIDVEVRNAAGAVVAGRDSLRSGGQIDFQGVRATLSYSTSNPPAVNTTYQIVTHVPRTITYKDKFAFSIGQAAISAQAIKDELHRVRVVPNPYVVASRFEEEFGALRREPLRQLKFIHLPPVCAIRIFTIDGDLVTTIEHTDGTGAATWDMRAGGGREIASGIYLYLIKTDNAERLDRFAVIK